MSEKLLDTSFTTCQKPPSLIFRKQNLRILIFEFLGTIILSVGAISTSFKLPISQHIPQSAMLHDIYISLSLYMGILLFGPLSGAHFNPVSSIGVYLNSHNQKMKIKTLFCYLLGQFIGAIVGCTFCHVVLQIGQGPFSVDQNYAINDVLVRFFGELIGTMFFVMFILILTTEQTTFIHQECWVHVFIPICLYGGRKLSKYVGGLNPAIVMVLQFVTFFQDEQKSYQNLAYCFIICGGQILGAVLAAIFFNNFFYKNLDKWRNC